MTERVLVTGATGFLAGHCVHELLDSGYSVRATVRDRSAAEKVAHLRAMGDIEFVAADLSFDDGWATAMDGCTYVLHVASPFPATMPDDENDLIRPAVDGTLRVLRAATASGTVRRVVLTSSAAAINVGHDDHRRLTEADWSTVDECPPYQKSKTLAERAAWDFVAALPEDRPLELVVINPGFILGPVQRAATSTSVDIVRRLLAHDVPGSPRIGWAIVDVRDLAAAHRLAMEVPGAAGNRYICADEEGMWLRDMAGVLAEEFDPRGFRVPTGTIPYWVLWLASRFDRSLRLGLYFAGKYELLSAAKARRELGWTMRPVRDTILDTANSLIEHDIVTPRAVRHRQRVALAGER